MNPFRWLVALIVHVASGVAARQIRAELIVLDADENQVLLDRATEFEKRGRADIAERLRAEAKPMLLPPTPATLDTPATAPAPVTTPAVSNGQAVKSIATPVPESPKRGPGRPRKPLPNVGPEADLTDEMRKLTDE